MPPFTANRKEIKALKTECSRLETELSAAEEEREALRLAYEISSRELATVRKELSDGSAKVNKLAGQVREQSEADLLVNALKAVGIIKTEPTQPVDFSTEEQRLNGLRNQALANYQGRAAGPGGLFSRGILGAGAGIQWP